jgi:outer membrane lipoprotein-sorting protein
MKRIMILLSAVMAIFLLQIPVLRGQDVKTEKKIKIIINDKDGEKVVIDTIVTGENSVKTITLDGGKMIFISDGDSHMHGGEKHVTVTVTDDETGEKGTEHHVSSDVAVWTTKEDGDEEKVIVVKKASGADSHSEKNMHVFVTSDGNESSIEKTRFVVAKDGMVVTVEGENEEKAKELMKIIEEHLGVNKPEEGKQEKTDSKKNKK